MNAAFRLLALNCVLAAAVGFAGEETAMRETLNVKAGLCVFLEDKDCAAALDAVRANGVIAYVQCTAAGDADAARRAADAAGLYGKRIFVGEGPLTRIHLADNLADAVVAPANAPKDEVLRVLRPQGRALHGKAEVVKPVPAGVDEWSHHYHTPDNNTQSRDTLARAPYLTQFIVEPRYGPAPQAAVASGGRLFMAFGHVAWHEREEPWMNALLAVNAYNGAPLWQKPLKQGIMVDRSTLIATPTALYVSDDKSCKVLDAATGDVQREITVPADVAGGSFWKWMALEDGTLYALVGADEPGDPDARWKMKNHGWPWDKISKGYNEGPYAWGFANVLFAIDAKTGKVRWQHRAEQPIDSRALCLKSGRLYLSSFGKYIVCLDAKDGREIWRRSVEKDGEIFSVIGPYRAGHGWIGGWKSTVYLRVSDKALYFCGPQVEWITALSADDGRVLWTHPKKDLHIVIRDDAVYTIGFEGSKGLSHKLDALTGKILESYDICRRACTRTTGTPDGILFRSPGGSVRLDLATGKAQWISVMRPSCHVGVVISGGQLYWLPWTCDCSLQMFGLISLAPAGEFACNQPARDGERLETRAGADAVAALEIAPADWPAYRGDNARGARTQAALPQKAALLWEYAPKSASEPTAPVVAGGLAFVAGADGVVRAFDAASGQAKWTAYTGGAVRYPPALAAGRAFVGAGDGWVYCFEAATGRLLWRFRAAPQERRIPFYGGLLSTWPVSSGVLVADGTAYCAAGINNFDGTHVYALDAATGKIKWQNNDSGHLDAFSRQGVSAQGDLLLHDGKLYLAGGTAASPAVYDAATGACANPAPKGGGTNAPRGRELHLANGKVVTTGQPLYSNRANPVHDASVKWSEAVVAAANGTLTYAQDKTAPGEPWVLFAKGADGQALWTQPLPCEPVRWGLAVDRAGRVLVTLRDGRVMCFGVGK
jgi:outer membrane protein assembly factor BamB